MTTLAVPPASPLKPAWRDDAAVIALVGLAHGVSHFSQLVLAPLFPWLKTEFGASYAELGALLTIFFAVSCAVQALSGFVVDRFGPRPVLFGGLSLLGLAALGYAAATSWWMLAACAVVAGIGNGVFHPVDYTLLNRRIHQSRLGHAYSAHGITGNLGWALAPVLLVPIALGASWRMAMLAAAALPFAVLAVLVLKRERLALPPTAAATGGATRDDSLGFLKLPAVWMCFWFFLLFAIALSVVQSFAPEAARQLHGVPESLVAVCLTSYMLGAAAGMVGGGFLASNPARCERVVAAGLGVAALIALWLALGSPAAAAVPALFGAMGLASGSASPSRDLLVKRSTPEHASGRVYGVVYSGLDIGQALAPLAFGVLMDHHRYQAVLVGLAAVQGLLILTAFNVRKARRTAPA